jgi:hypothetical protein
MSVRQTDGQSSTTKMLEGGHAVFYCHYPKTVDAMLTNMQTGDQTPIKGLVFTIDLSGISHTLIE